MPSSDGRNVNLCSIHDKNRNSSTYEKRKISVDCLSVACARPSVGKTKRDSGGGVKNEGDLGRVA